MTLLSKEQLDQVARAISEAESRTDAELVCVLAPCADDYHYIPTLWAAGVALLVPGLAELSGLWWSTIEIWWLQLGIFMGLALLLRWPPLLARIVPRRIRFWRAGNLARRQFLEQNLHHTQGGNGVLVFVSEVEHYVEIIADRGVASVIDNAQWAAVIDSFTRQVKAGQTLAGFVDCIHACGELLAEHRPATRDKNELPNHLVVLGS